MQRILEIGILKNSGLSQEEIDMHIPPSLREKAIKQNNLMEESTVDIVIATAVEHFSKHPSIKLFGGIKTKMPLMFNLKEFMYMYTSYMTCDHI